MVAAEVVARELLGLMMASEGLRRRRARARGRQDVIQYLNAKADKAARIRWNSEEVRTLRGLVKELQGHNWMLPAEPPARPEPGILLQSYVPSPLDE